VFFGEIAQLPTDLRYLAAIRRKIAIQTSECLEFRRMLMENLGRMSVGRF
jgi:hypothetical protein